jgi:hypothetical protein
MASHRQLENTMQGNPRLTRQRDISRHLHSYAFSAIDIGFGKVDYNSSDLVFRNLTLLRSSRQGRAYQSWSVLGRPTHNPITLRRKNYSARRLYQPTATAVRNILDIRPTILGNNHRAKLSSSTRGPFCGTPQLSLPWERAFFTHVETLDCIPKHAETPAICRPVATLVQSPHPYFPFVNESS